MARDLRAAVELAAAHGLTERTIATWSARVPRTPRVLVPVQLDALVVRDDGGTWADCALRAKPPQAAGEVLNRRDLLPAPFTDLAQPRERGVYLHWALPDALTHGTVLGNTTTFPAIPDRWLVLRFSPSAAGRAVRGWVLMSGGKDPVVTPLDQWTEPGPSPDAADNPFTALGQGDLGWAAYYDNVVGRLAFHDDLADVAAGPLAYLVCGWYSDASKDPLGDAAVRSLADFDAKMLGLRWQLAAGELHEAVARSRQFTKAATLAGLATLEAVGTRGFLARASGDQGGPPDPNDPVGPPSRDATTGGTPPPLGPDGQPVGGEYVTDGSWWPKLTLCHGSVVGIGWPGIGFPGQENGLLSGEVGGPPSPDAITVGIGNTLMDAMAALVAKRTGRADETRVLEGFMLGALAELDRSDGRARVDALLHASAFGSLDGGSVTEIIHEAEIPAGPTQPKPSGPPDPGIFPKTAPKGGAGGGGRFGTVLGDVNALDEVLTAQPVSLPPSVPPAQHAEVRLLAGGLLEAVSHVKPTPPPQPTPARDVEVRRALPRYFRPADPVVLVQGGARSFKHGDDGRFSQDGMLICRLTGFCVTELSSLRAGGAGRVAVRGDDVLDRGVENGSVPPECEDLLRETVLLDPGSAVVASRVALSRTVGPAHGLAAPGLDEQAVTVQARNMSVEQTAWWASRDARVDHGPLVSLSGIQGLLPSPIAVTPPVRPWAPLHLDWRVTFFPSANGVDDWSLGEIDYATDESKIPPADQLANGITLDGRALLTGGAAQAIAANVRRALAQASSAGGAASLTPGVRIRFHSDVAAVLTGAIASLRANVLADGGGGAAGGAGGAGGDGGVPPIDRSLLDDIASALESMDVLGGALDHFHGRLRGGFEGDGVSAPKPGDPLPSPFLPLRAGFLRIVRLRLVDGFGQVVDLAGSGANAPADGTKIVSSDPMVIAGRPELQELPPRFTSPARLWLRWLDASGDPREAGPGVSPVCGYLMPNHLDGALEVFDDAGTNLGMLRPDAQAGVVWEESPGTPSTVGQSPRRAIPNAFLAELAQSVLDWGAADADAAPGREPALASLLRIIDSTLWSVDPFGHAGDEHLALLVGHPVVVLRAMVRLELKEPIAPELANRILVPLRLGALTHWQDGLLGYFVGDDYTTLYCADAAVAGFAREVGPGRGFLQQANLVPDFYASFFDDLAIDDPKTPVKHPFVDNSGVRLIAPNRDFKLTLLVEPHCVVHATAGLLPRKEIGMRREWIAAALAKLSPTFRFGPLLVDPKRIRMPVPSDIHGTWSWDHRADVTTWAEDPIVNSTGDAVLPANPSEGTEGWLRMTPPPPDGKS